MYSVYAFDGGTANEDIIANKTAMNKTISSCINVYNFIFALTSSIKMEDRKNPHPP